MTEKRIGIYEFGPFKFEVFIDSNLLGGSVDFDVKDKQHKMVVGIKYTKGEWHRILANLLHESYEGVMFLMRIRFEPCSSMGWNTDRYIFVMDHPHFCDVSLMVAEGVAEVQSEIYKEWQKYLKNKKEKK